MANYSLVSTAKYNPFNLQELIAVNNMWEMQHQQLEDAYGELSTKASIWENKASQQTDKRTYNQYKKYADDLREQADTLASNGLNSSSRQAMMDMRTRFNSEILPIEEAYKKREAWIEAQRAGKAAGQIYDEDAATMSLDRILFDKVNTYNTIDTRAKQKEAEDLYSMMANDLNAAAGMSGPRVDAYHKTFKQKYGITAQEASNFLSAVRSGNLNLADPTLLNIYNTIWEGSGINNWQGNQNANKIALRDAILRGVRTAVGKDTYQMYTDEQAKANLEVATYKRKKQIDKEEEDEKIKQQLNEINYGRRDLFSKVQKDENTKYWNTIRKYIYFDKNGNFESTLKGRKLANEKYKSEATRQAELNLAKSLQAIDDDKTLTTSEKNSRKFKLQETYNNRLKNNNQYSSGQTDPERTRYNAAQKELNEAINALGLQDLFSGKKGSHASDRSNAVISHVKDMYNTKDFDAIRHNEYTRRIDDIDAFGEVLNNMQARGVFIPKTKKFNSNGQYEWSDIETPLNGAIDPKQISSVHSVVNNQGAYYEVTTKDGSVYDVPLEQFDKNIATSVYADLGTLTDFSVEEAKYNTNVGTDNEVIGAINNALDSMNSITRGTKTKVYELPGAVSPYIPQF